jgi:hypothetical protein
MDCLRVSVALTDPAGNVGDRQHGWTVYDVRIPAQLASPEDYVALVAESLLDAAYNRT